MNDKVTPRSIAYAAVQVFDLMHFVRLPTHVYLYSSFTSICRPLSNGTKFTEDSITVAFTTTLLTFLKTCKTALRRHVHMTYLSGGLCKSAFHGLERSLTYVCLVEKSSQLPPLASSPALLLLARLWRSSVPLAADAILDVFREWERVIFHNLDSSLVARDQNIYSVRKTNWLWFYYKRIEMHVLTSSPKCVAVDDIILWSDYQQITQASSTGRAPSHMSHRVG